MWLNDSQAEDSELRTESRGHDKIKIMGLVTRRRKERKIRKALQRSVQRAADNTKDTQGFSFLICTSGKSTVDIMELV